MTRKSMRSNEMALMLTVLAVLDTGILWVDMSHAYIRRVHGINIRTFSNFSCKMHRWIYMPLSFTKKKNCTSLIRTRTQAFHKHTKLPILALLSILFCNWTVPKYWPAQSCRLHPCRSHTEGHGRHPIRLPRSPANDTCYRHIFEVLHSTVQMK